MPTIIAGTQGEEIDVMGGDSGSGGTEGLVPAPAAGDAAAGKFLKANASWAVPSAGDNSSFTRLFRTSNQAHPGANVWQIITWQGVDEDPLSAFNAGTPTFVTVPNGITKMKAIFRASWTNVVGGNRYLMIAAPAFVAPYYGGDIRSGINEALTSVATPWTTVVAGTQIACFFNPGGTGTPTIAGNASITGVFGGATAIEFEWR